MESLFSSQDEKAEIQAATDAGINQGHKAADGTWKKMALECVKVICLEKETFTMNDVRWLIRMSPIKTHDNRAVGGIVKMAQKLNWIKPTGQSITSKVGHKSQLQVWKSNLYQHPKLFP